MRRGALLLVGAACASVAACGWNPSRPFDREAPAVRTAVALLDAGDASSATLTLEDYLSTGPCRDGNIGTPNLLKRRPDGTFDLGLSLFAIAEQFGRRFGEEEVDAGVSGDTRDQRHAQIECARRMTEAIAEDDAVPLDLRARARYLAGNLAFLDRDYEGAVSSYDKALVLAPGLPDGGGDPLGRDAAWNRAIALRRIEDRKDAGPDAPPDAPPDAAPDGPKDSGQDGPKDSGQDGSKDAGQDGQSDRPDGGEGRDGGSDSGPEASPPSSPEGGAPEAGAKPPPPATDQDERMLDQLENAPTMQQEEAKRAGKKRVRGMADK